MKKWYVVIDVAKCGGCNNCFMACKDEHVDNAWPGFALPQPRHGHRWIDVVRKERGQYPMVDVAYRPTTCSHCDNAPCIGASGGAVYRRDDGIVIIDPVKAKGKMEIVKACPHEMIWWNETEQVPQKCTMCAHLLDSGWKTTRCVQACPTGALRLENCEDADMDRFIVQENLTVLLPETTSRALVYYKNLNRYAKCFISGSVAVRVNGLEDCVEGASITLRKGLEKIGELHSDEFGDFKFDGLEEDSGAYQVEVEFSGFRKETVAVDLKESENIGVIYCVSCT